MMDDHAARSAKSSDRSAKTTATAISFGEREVALTVSVGAIARFRPKFRAKGGELLQERRDRDGQRQRGRGQRSRRIVLARDAHAALPDRPSLEGDLRRALDRGEIKVFFQPIVRLEDRTVAGFRGGAPAGTAKTWPIERRRFHVGSPKRPASSSISAFSPCSGQRADYPAWQKALEVEPPIFASINVSSRQLLRHDLLKDVQAALNRSFVLRGTLKLELTESTVEWKDQEFAAQMPSGSARSRGQAHNKRWHRLFLIPAISSAIISTRSRSTNRWSARTRSAPVRSFCARSSPWPMTWGWMSSPRAPRPDRTPSNCRSLGCEFAQGFAFGQPLSAADARQVDGRGERAESPVRLAVDGSWRRGVVSPCLRAGQRRSMSRGLDEIPARFPG